MRLISEKLKAFAQTPNYPDKVTFIAVESALAGFVGTMAGAYAGLLSRHVIVSAVVGVMAGIFVILLICLFVILAWVIRILNRFECSMLILLSIGLTSLTSLCGTVILTFPMAAFRYISIAILLGGSSMSLLIPTLVAVYLLRQAKTTTPIDNDHA